jgi:hypothetical protein
MLAPTYRNMVPRDHFVAHVAQNHNFDKPVAIAISRSRSINGAVTLDCSWGELGNAEVTIVDTAEGSQTTLQVAAISINGTPALPAPP